MAGRTKWSEIKKRAAPETLERWRKKTETFRVAMELNELREARGLTQEQLAERLGIRQTNVSKMEQRHDLHISTLRAVVEAMGGRLILTAQFPDENIRINRSNSTSSVCWSERTCCFERERMELRRHRMHVDPRPASFQGRHTSRVGRLSFTLPAMLGNDANLTSRSIQAISWVGKWERSSGERPSAEWRAAKQISTW